MTNESTEVTQTYKIPVTVMRRPLRCPRCEASLHKACWSRKFEMFFCTSCAEAITRLFWDRKQGITRGGTDSYPGPGEGKADMLRRSRRGMTRP